MTKAKFKPGDIVEANHSSPYGGPHAYKVGDRFTVEAVREMDGRIDIRLAGRPEGIWSGPGGFHHAMLCDE